MTTDSETMEQYLNFIRTRFLISVLVFVSHDYELGRVSDFREVDRQSRKGLIFMFRSWYTRIDPLDGGDCLSYACFSNCAASLCTVVLQTPLFTKL